MGAYTMRCSLSLLVPLMILAAPAAGLAQSPQYNVGTPLSQEEIKRVDFMIGPQGQQPSEGHGDPESTRLNSSHPVISYALFFFNDTATTEIYTLSLHDALPIYGSLHDAMFS